MARRTTLAIGLAALTAGAVVLANRPPTAPCAPFADDADVQRFRAAAVVARPWRGPHHVYALFVVPNQFASRAYLETVRVREYEEHFARNRFPKPQQLDGVVAPAGHYVKRVFVPTRVAGWFLLTGHFGDLRTPCNWTLVFTSRGLPPPVPAE